MRTILAIDDQKDNLTTIKAVIKGNIPDCNVITALSGKEGIEIAKKELPDTILLDVIMPEMDGFETCKRLKKIKETSNIPIIMLTATKTDIDSRVGALNIGADAFLTKPINASELTAQINVMLRIKSAEDLLRGEKDSLEELVSIRTAKLKKSEEQLRSAVELAPNPIMIHDEDNRILQLSKGWTKYSGYTIEDIPTIGDWTEKAYGAKSEFAKKNIDELFEIKETINNGYWEIKSKSGEIKNWEFFTTPLGRTRKGKRILLSTAIDHTERKRSEQLQKVLYNISYAVISTSSVKELIELIKEELDPIIDTTNFYIALYDPKTDTFTLPYLADEMEELTSFPAGKSFTNYVLKTQKSLLANKEKTDKMIRSGEVEMKGIASEIWLGVPLKLEEKIIGVLALQSYKDANAYSEKDIELLEFISDQISLSISRKEAEEELKNALKKATESDRLKSAFLATMSHELRTPLNAVIGFSELLNKDTSIDEIVQFGEIINTSGYHLLNIVKELFDLTLIETGEINIIKEDLNLYTILQDVYQIIKLEQQKTENDHLKLKLIIPQQLKEVNIYTDSSKFQQILINLLKNALKFTHEGHVHFGFKIETLENDQRLKFYVEDSGIGVPKDKQSFIFDNFRQIEETNTKTYGGAGIGLSISKKLAELLGGEIWLESEEGKGSTFYFTIPYVGSHKIEAGDISRSKVTEGKKELYKNKTILIVEDDDSSYEYLNVILKMQGVNILRAMNGLAAIKHCKENSAIDLVLMDINMPIMDGYVATKEIKKFKPNLPIISQTAFAIAGDRQKSFDAGCDKYIPKPIDKEILLEMIAELLS